MLNLSPERLLLCGFKILKNISEALKTSKTKCDKEINTARLSKYLQIIDNSRVILNNSTL